MVAYRVFLYLEFAYEQQTLTLVPRLYPYSVISPMFIKQMSLYTYIPNPLYHQFEAKQKGRYKRGTSVFVVYYYADIYTFLSLNIK